MSPDPNASDNVDIQGIVEKILFCNDKGDYTVAIIQDLNGNEAHKVVGPLGPLEISSAVQISGTLEKHDVYGSQIRATRVVPTVPTSDFGIRKYLASGVIDGVGSVLADRLVDAFGSETLEILENQPQRLKEVEGVGKKKIRSISQAFKSQESQRHLLIFLHGLGLGPSLIARILKTYGQATIATLKKNPYRLIRDVSGVGFLSADRIALELGVPPESVERSSAAADHHLRISAERGGNTCLPRAVLTSEVQELLGCTAEKAKEGIDHGIENGHLVAEELKNGEDPWIYLHSLHWSESSAAHRIDQLLTTPRVGPTLVPEALTAWAESLLKIELSPRQRDAVAAALTRKFSIITGGPGVGKTTVIRSICTILEAKKVSVALAAPTGRAAKRLKETTGRQAKTLHRMLRFDPATSEFGHNQSRPLEYDVVIIDESSMLDIWLFHSLLDGLKDSTTLILVGDVDQLPSVGPGRVLADIIESKTVEVVRLTQIFRQSEQSQIVVNAHRINQGQLPDLSQESSGGDLREFYFIEREDPLEVQRTLVHLVTEHIPKTFHLDRLNDIQVLTPMHKGACGSKALNQCLQGSLNPAPSPELKLIDEPSQEAASSSDRFRLTPGDKVMQIKNNYDKEVFNGDIGRVISISEKNKAVLTEFEGVRVLYEAQSTDELAPSYAITVHKSQGSEYPCIVLPLVLQHSILLQRNLLYTAVTRAKKLVVVIGSRRALQVAVANKRGSERYSGLGMRLSREPKSHDD